MPSDVNYKLEPASVQYGDWVGTAAADEHMTVGHGDLYELVALDQDRWWIVAMEIDGISEFYVYAIDKLVTGISGHSELVKYHSEHGEVPVTSFLVHDTSPARLIQLMTMFSIQVRTRSLEGRDLTVKHLADLRYSGD